MCIRDSKYAVALIGSLSDGVALELVQTFLREVVVIEIVIAQEGQIDVYKRQVFVLVHKW